MKYETIELFPVHLLRVSIEDRIAQAIQSILRLFISGQPVVVAFSGGKDSSVVAALTLDAALQAKELGASPFVVVTTGDTDVENPEIALHYRAELAKMRQFGEERGINVQVAVARPNILSTFQMKVLTGRGLPSFPNGSSDCSTYGDSSSVNSAADLTIPEQFARGSASASQKCPQFSSIRPIRCAAC